MRLVVNQDFLLDQVEPVKVDDNKTGLIAGDVVLSQELYDKIKQLLNEDVVYAMQKR